MAMIKCPECGKEISDRAPSCPECGYPFQSGTIIPKKYLLHTAAAVLGAVLLVVMFTQTTLFWSGKDKALADCAKMIQNDLLAPHSLLIYSAAIWNETMDESASPSSDAGDAGAATSTKWVWIHYGAETKGGGIADGVALFEKSDGKWQMHERSNDEYDTSTLEGSKRAAGTALYNIWLEGKMFDVQLYGKMYSDESITRVIKKLT